mmetsp:Transcript_1936/g.4156  ORF Transcript_1936/g.4156 Transcript_1936/m.4156 type:complete len:287 (+) Transcript_1936:186-1046(+)
MLSLTHSLEVRHELHDTGAHGRRHLLLLSLGRRLGHRVAAARDLVELHLTGHRHLRAQLAHVLHAARAVELVLGALQQQDAVCRRQLAQVVGPLLVGAVGLAARVQGVAAAYERGRDTRRQLRHTLAQHLRQYAAAKGGTAEHDWQHRVRRRRTLGGRDDIADVLGAAGAVLGPRDRARLVKPPDGDARLLELRVQVGPDHGGRVAARTGCEEQDGNRGLHGRGIGGRAAHRGLLLLARWHCTGRPQLFMFVGVIELEPVLWILVEAGGPVVAYGRARSPRVGHSP